MSETSGTPYVQAQGSDVDSAAERIGELMDRESGKPAAPERPAQRERPAFSRLRNDERRAPVDEAEPDEKTEPEEDADDDADEDTDEASNDEAEDADENAEEDAGDDDGDDDAEDTDASEASPDAMVTVKIDGKDQKIPVQELAASYHRNADYTRKMMALSDERKGFEAERNSVRTERNQYGQLLANLQQQLESVQEPDWQALYQTDRLEYLTQMTLKQERDAKLGAIRQEHERLSQLAKAEADREKKTVMEREKSALAKAMPAWTDHAKWAAAQETIRDYGLAQGWTLQQLRDVDDHRAILTLYKAALYDRAMQRKPQPTKRPLAPPAPPGARQQQHQPRKVTELTRAKQRLAKTGDLHDAAAAISRLL